MLVFRVYTCLPTYKFYHFFVNLTLFLGGYTPAKNIATERGRKVRGEGAHWPRFELCVPGLALAFGCLIQTQTW